MAGRAPNRYPGDILPGGAAASPTGEPSAPEKLEILLVSASPLRASRQLAVDEEFARIIEKLRHRSNLKITQRTAVTFDRLQSALNDFTPQILHISCHGKPGYLYSESERSGDPSTAIHQDALVQTLDALDPPLRLVVLNACDSLSIAQRIVTPDARVAEWAIGMNAPIYDHDAISFSATLYDTIAAGRSLDAAFKTAVARLMADAPPGQDPDAPHAIPRLVPDDRAQAKKAVLVAPSARARIE
ncbi:CHAT domain-containing protein [Nannocystis pusilla]|uniref:CHAT domain-containing protein n=1 Tax=Nannocystis pusilla TaxID=889268 RepID=A0A9X3EPP3_9BACT|nr:CHAT domain-containing protein [Nannocystis pusilla]MCY1004506.1 CHAT domain-containing protein [Nannocystis pusilla]